MRPVSLDDVLGRERYGAVRDAVRRRLIEHKRRRRVAVGDRLSLVFEDRATVWYQTQEMLWVERIVDLDAIREELVVYGALLPGVADLSATLLVEIVDQARMREEFQRLLGLDRHVALQVGSRRLPGRFEEGRQTDEKISAVQYVRFPVDEAARGALATSEPVTVVVDHPNYVVTAPLPDAVRASVVGSFLDPAVADADLRYVREGAR
jgi:hypothetical protein